MSSRFKFVLESRCTVYIVVLFNRIARSYGGGCVNVPVNSGDLKRQLEISDGRNQRCNSNFRNTVPRIAEGVLLPLDKRIGYR